ncbi:hypothetical protein [Acetobacterium sp.]|uniref:hypothetical protein n=1 Tax=Acetobacterium sp. TaxID=1872094 RepID=UPI002F3F3CF0
MSLDMDLSKDTYVGSSGNKLKITGITSQIQVHRVKYITEEIAVWRKANAIHQWFVNNVQAGEDDCKPYYVSTEQLRELLERCKQVLKEPDTAPKLLPTQEGFLFGSTEYDNRYFQSLDYTVEVLEAELKENDNQLQEYKYQSDW